MIPQEEKIEMIEQKIIENRIQRNKDLIKKYRSSKRKKPLKLLDTAPNFFIAKNDRGFCVIHLEAFMKLSKSKQKKLIEIGEKEL